MNDIYTRNILKNLEKWIDRSLRNFINKYKPERAIVITKDYWNSIKINSTKIKFVPVCYL